MSNTREKAGAMEERRSQRRSSRRAVADRPDLHRTEQDHRPRLPARRNHGPADVRRSDLSAAHGGDPVAGAGPADGSDAGVVHRPWRHSAVDAGGAAHRHDRCGAARLRGRRRARLREISRWRHRELHAVPRYRAGNRAAWRLVPQGGGGDRPAVRWTPARSRRASAIDSTRGIRGRRGCSRWRSSSRRKRNTSR